jgi:hypothetical protein
MSDDKQNRGNPDRQRIDVNDPKELNNWAKSLGVSTEEIEAAVRKVGSTADRVREYLQR